MLFGTPELFLWITGGQLSVSGTMLSLDFACLQDGGFFCLQRKAVRAIVWVVSPALRELHRQRQHKEDRSFRKLLPMWITCMKLSTQLALLNPTLLMSVQDTSAVKLLGSPLQLNRSGPRDAFLSRSLAFPSHTVMT